MAWNDTHFTSPDRTPGQSLKDYNDNVAFRQQLASVFQPFGPHNVRMETGHTILPMTGDNDGRGPAAVIHHRSAGYPIILPLGHDPEQWFPNLVKHLNSREVMEQMRDQMNGRHGR